MPPSGVPRRILIIDFDLHHGDGVQQIFYRDPDVCYISIHRGALDGQGLEGVEAGGRGKGFFPGTGLAAEVGDGPGLGLNVNIPFEDPGMGDHEYKMAWNTVVMPIARQFDPDLVFLCAGFDAAAGDKNSQGEFELTAPCFGWMVRQTMTLGRVVLALEGGYDIPEIVAGGLECMRALQGLPGSEPDGFPPGEQERGVSRDTGNIDKDEVLSRGPEDAAHLHALATLRRVVEIQGRFWALDLPPHSPP